MGARKDFKTIFLKADSSDKVREMMIASANYADISEFLICPSKESITNQRKRRLDNLSPEEKILRKKLKNREAAQTSRDKKKAYVNSLEDTICQLRKENEDLHLQIKALREENERLKSKDASLEKEFSHVAVTDANITGSAVPHFLPLPQGLLALVAAVAIPLHLLMTFCLISMTSVGLMTSQNLPILKNWINLQNHYSKKLYIWNHLKRMKTWWGPDQKSWNPLAIRLTAVI